MDVFISHVHEDETLASELKGFLEGLFLNASVFVSGRDLAGGELWSEELRSRLEKSTVIIALVTRYSSDSNWVHFEAGVGFVRKCTIPLVADGVTIDALRPPLKLLQARTFDDEGLRLLAQDIAQLARLRSPDRFPGLSEVTKSADKFIHLRSEDAPSAPAESGSTSRARSKEPKIDATLTELRKRLHEAISTAIELHRPTFDIPTAEKMQNLELRELLELADAVGVPAPYSYGVALKNLQAKAPVSTDPPWKAMNYERDLRNLASMIAKLENQPKDPRA